MVQPWVRPNAVVTSVVSYAVTVVVWGLILSGIGCGRVRESEVPSPSGSMDPGTVAELSRRLQSLLDGLVEAHANVHGGLLLVEGPGFRWIGASGLAIEATGLPMLPEDQFAIDSIAKTFTSTIVMKLVEDGRLGLDDSIDRYLPAEVIDGLHVFEGRSYGNEITVRQLLNHTSGIPDDWACADFLQLIATDLERRWTPEETVEYVKENCESQFPPGEGFAYSDTGYNLLGLIVENVTASPLHEAGRELVFEPLGMDHTYRPAFEGARPSVAGRAPSERYFGDVECSLAPAVMTADWGGGGLISTTEDLNRFLRAFAHNEIFDEPKTRDTMLAWVDSGPFHGYGYGISLVDYDRSDDPAHVGIGRIWGHAGSSQNFMFYWPSRDITMISTLNQIDSERSRYDIIASVMHTVLEMTEDFS